MLHELNRLFHGIPDEDRSIENHLWNCCHGCNRAFLCRENTPGEVEEGGLMRRWRTVRDKVLLLLLLLPHVHWRGEGLTGSLLPSGEWRRGAVAWRLLHLGEFR